MDRVSCLFRGTQRFRLVAPLGAGGMGVVYEAVDRDDGSAIALKVLPNVRPEAVVAFKTEFRSLRSIHHSNLVTMGELIEDAGQLFFTMELVRGVDILAYVRSGAAPGCLAEESYDQRSAAEPTAPVRHGLVRARSPGRSAARAQEPQLRMAFGDLARGLVHLHGASKVHRDIKPSNVIVTHGGRTVLLDFGLVADVERPSRRPEAALLGSVSYVSPEQAAGQPATFASDWYSFGVMLFEALTGGPPFVGTIQDILGNKESYDGPAPSGFAGDVPPDLDRLCEALLQRDPARRPSGSEVLARFARSSDADFPAPPRRRPVQGGFVGRTGELAQLKMALREAAREPLVVMVGGESGVGKTSLATRFLAEVRAESDGRAFVFYGRCSERERIPFKAFDEIASEIAEVAFDADRPASPARLPAFLAALRGASTIFPALLHAASQIAPDRAPPSDSVARRAVAFQCVREIVRLFSEHAPVVLCIDDWQWADADSAALLASVLLEPSAPAALVLLLTRDEARCAIPADRRITVGNLGANEAVHLAADGLKSAGLAPAAIDDAAASVATESTGHPLFILELVQQVAMRGHDTKGTLRLDDALWERFSALEPAAKNATQLLATARAPTSFSVFCEAMRILGTPLEWSDRPRLMDRLQLQRFARFEGLGAADRVDCFHDRVATAILSRLDPVQRQACHRALALSLENAATLDFEKLAAHWLGAGDPERAADRAEVAGDRAMAGLAFERAAELFRLRLSLRADEAKDGGVHAKLGAALGHTGRGAEAADEYLAAARMTPPSRRVVWQRLAADQLFRSGHFEAAVRLAEEVFEAMGMPLPKTPWKTILGLLLQRMALWLRGDGFRWRAAGAVREDALARVDASWSVAIGLGMVDNFRGSYVQSFHLRMALNLGEPFRVLRAMALEVSYRATEGSRSRNRIEGYICAAEDLAREIGDPYALGFTHLTRGIGSYLCGDWAEARRASESAEAIFENRPAMASWELATARLFSLFSHFYMGDVAVLHRRVPRLVREATDRGDLFAAINFRLTLCNAAWLVTDEPSQASRHLDAAEAQCPKEGAYIQEYWCAMARANLCLYEGRPEQAHRRAVGVWPTLRRSMLLRMEIVRIEFHWLRGRCALSRAQVDRSRRQELLGEVNDCAMRLARELPAWSKSLSFFLKAGAHALGGAESVAEECFRAGAGAAELASLGLMASLAGVHAAAREGRGRAWVTEQGVARPERWLAMFLPGW
jgi:hypothetical protein